MQAREQGPGPDPGMLGCDREVFAQVWSRVDPGAESVVEPVTRSEAPPRDGSEPLPCPEGSRGPVELGEEDREGRRLQELTLSCLWDAAIYQQLTRRSRRAGGELTELARRKTRQAKRLSAAYFLRTGVRYWPREATPAQPPESFFPALRQRFLAERQMAGTLEALGRETAESDLAELYLSLAEEAAETGHMIRLIVERET